MVLAFLLLSAILVGARALSCEEFQSNDDHLLIYDCHGQMTTLTCDSGYRFSSSTEDYITLSCHWDSNQNLYRWEPFDMTCIEDNPTGDVGLFTTTVAIDMVTRLDINFTPELGDKETAEYKMFEINYSANMKVQLEETRRIFVAKIAVNSLDEGSVIVNSTMELRVDNDTSVDDITEIVEGIANSEDNPLNIIRNSTTVKSVSYCESSPCQNGGTCNDSVAGFVCACDIGWTGQFCNTSTSTETTTHPITTSSPSSTTSSNTSTETTRHPITTSSPSSTTTSNTSTETTRHPITTSSPSSTTTSSTSTETTTHPITTSSSSSTTSSSTSTETTTHPITTSSQSPMRSSNVCGKPYSDESEAVKERERYAVYECADGYSAIFDDIVVIYCNQMTEKWEYTAKDKYFKCIKEETLDKAFCIFAVVFIVLLVAIVRHCMNHAKQHSDERTAFMTNNPTCQRNQCQLNVQNRTVFCAGHQPQPAQCMRNVNVPLSNNQHICY